MPTLGEELKQRREARGITLADISEATRIGTRFLKAIESDNYSVLPGGIFTRSFIRAYAREVGMDEDEALALYQHEVTGETEEPAEQPPEPPSPVTDSVSRRWRTAAIALGIVVLAGLIAVAIIRLTETEPDGSADGPVQPTPTQTGDAGTDKPRIVETGPTPSSQASAQPSAAPTARPAKEDRIAVTLEAATQDCWIRYTLDDGDPSTIILKAGETRQLAPARDRVLLLIGNRPTLKLKINGMPASFPPETPNFAAQVEISRDRLPLFFQ